MDLPIHPLRRARGLRRLGAALALSGLLAGTTGPAAAITPEAGVAPAVTQAAPYMMPFRVGSMRVAPSNNHAAFLAVSKQGRRVLAVVDLANPKDVRVVAGYRDLDVEEFHWVNDRRLVYSVFPQQLTMMTRSDAGILAVDIDGKRQQLLVELTESQDRPVGTNVRTKVLPWGWDFFRRLPDRGDQALFYEYDRTGLGPGRVRSLARLDTDSLNLEHIGTGAPPNAVHHVVDAAGDLRIVVTEDAGRARVHHRPQGSREWVVVEDLPTLDGARIWPLYIEADGSWVVTSRRGRDTDALYVYDPRKRKIDPEPLVAVNGFDVQPNLVVDNARRAVIGVYFTAAQPMTLWFDERMAQLQKVVDGLLPAGRSNWLLCGHCPTAQRFVVQSHGDRMPGEYFVFDLVAKRLINLSSAVPELPEASQGRRTYHRVAARDGLSLPVVVTHPVGVDPGTPRPLVVLVHGGPNLRGGSRLWDGEAQFLAARGYRVLEVEFRGSTGFGAGHFEAGFKQWGQAMQDDLADAVNWAVREKMGEPGRACIVGGSYGGYAALMGPVRHPELYRCAASLNGVTDLTRMFDRFWTDISSYAQRYLLTETLGDPVTDKAMLERFSPINRVADIKVPVLVAWGGEDRRVDPAHSRRFVSAARAAGLNVEVREYPNEGHGFYEDANRIDHAERLARFLATHLPAGGR